MPKVALTVDDKAASRVQTLTNRLISAADNILKERGYGKAERKEQMKKIIHCEQTRLYNLYNGKRMLTAEEMYRIIFKLDMDDELLKDIVR